MTVGERFSAFFAEANGGAVPYPWQVALVETIASTGRWPDIAAPTGAGKSSVVDVHVFLVAEHAAGHLQTRPPRRLVLVAPRRVLVDDQFERAVGLATALADASAGGALAEAASSLRGLRTSQGEDAAVPLTAWRLRGGVSLENGWRLEPAACQVICATPQMWGSRVLFRGFNASRNSRNLEAGLLGQDSVVVVDEAHLHERLVDTARNVARRSSPAMGLQVVAMSATRAPSSAAAALTDDDYADPNLARRVRANKTVEVVSVPDWSANVVAATVAAARAAHGGGTVGIFVNDVTSALRVAAELAGGEQGVEIVCGRMRPADLDRLRARRPGLLSQRGNPEVSFLVATQSLEVGVDLDLAAMVTMLAPAAALVQRAGRLNRSGRRPESRFVVLAPEDLDDGASGSPYTVDELAAAEGWLRKLGTDISPEAVAHHTLPPVERPVLPALRAPDLETLALSSDLLAADPDVELYLQEPGDVSPEVQVAARMHLGLEDEVVQAALLACPPRSHEVATLRLGAQLQRVAQQALAYSGGAWVLRFCDGMLQAERLTDVGDLAPRDTLVVGHGAPVCTAGILGLVPGLGTPGPLDDVLAEAPAGAPEDHVVPLPAADVAPLLMTDPLLDRRASRLMLAELLAAEGHVSLAARMKGHRRLSSLAVQWCGGEDAVGLLVVRDRGRSADVTLAAANEEPVRVDDHQAAVARRLSRILEVLAPDGLGVAAEALTRAAELHDQGKLHPRFQRRMGAGEVPLAKPLPGHVPDAGDGWRHEQLSAAYAAAAYDGDPLIVALIGAHHGRGRALFDRDDASLIEGWAGCPPEVAEWTRRLYGSFGTYELLRDRVQRELGAPRLAYLEALLRCADMQVSKEGS